MDKVLVPCLMNCNLFSKEAETELKQIQFNEIPVKSFPPMKFWLIKKIFRKMVLKNTEHTLESSQ